MGDNTRVANHRTPSEHPDTNIATQQNFPSGHRDPLAGVTNCSPYLVLGMALAVLFVGIGLTAASFQSFRETDNRLAVIAPLCLIAGLIATSRLIYKKFKLLKQSNQCGTPTTNSAQLTQVEELTTTTIGGFQQRQLEEDEQAIYLEPTSPDSMCPYSDDPPSYAQVAHGGLYQQQQQPPRPMRVVQPVRLGTFGAIVNPALEIESQDPVAGVQDGGIGPTQNVSQTNSWCSTTPATQDQMPPPPPYDECKHITQTSL